MYCAERKQEYIRYCTANGADLKYQKKLKLLFSHTGAFESSENTDVSIMTDEQVCRMLQSGIIGKTRICTSLCMLRAYAMWCAESDPAVFGSGILSYLPDGLEKTRRCMVSGDIHLNDVMNILFAPEEDGRADNILRAFLWLVYAGVFPDQIFNITKEDIDFMDLTVRSCGVVYKISRLACPSLRFCSESDTVAVDHPQYKSRRRIQGSSIMRGTRSVLCMHVLTNRLSLIQKDAEESGKLQMDFSPYDIFKSGRFADMYEAERGGVFPDFSLDVDVFMNHKTNRFGKQYKHYGNDAFEVHKRMMSAVFLEDYSRWKLAFTSF